MRESFFAVVDASYDQVGAESTDFEQAPLNEFSKKILRRSRQLLFFKIISEIKTFIYF